MDNRRILCVDDEAAVRDVIIEMLSLYDYEVQCVPNAQAAFDIFEKFNPFLVLTDLTLRNHVDGATMADRLHRLSPLTTFVAVSGYVDAFDMGYLIGAVFCDVLKKPFEMADLLDIVEHAYQRRQRWVSYMKI